jgi:hypothetical protein
MADETPAAVVNETDEKSKKTLNETLGLLGVPVKDRPADLAVAIARVKSETIKLLADFDARSKELTEARKEVKKLESAAKVPEVKGDVVNVEGGKYEPQGVHGEPNKVVRARELADALKQQYIDENDLVILVKKI